VRVRVGHVGIEVGDLFTMERFYRAALGLSLGYRYVSRNTRGLRTVFLERDGLRIELLERPRPAPFPGERVHVPNHVSLEVDDVDLAYARLAALRFPGVTLTPPRNTGDGFREVELRDPEGNVVELSARVRPPPRIPLSAVVFDLDGTLVDSEPSYYLADRELLARRGIAFSEQDKRRYIGGGNLEMMVDLKRRFALPEAAEALVEEKNAIYLEFVERGLGVYPEMRRFLELVRGEGIPVAVASGTSPLVLRRVLQATGLAAAFPVVVSAEEVARGKPWPEIFLETALRLGIPPEECLVVEDSRPGVEAALRAFMRCLAVPYLDDRPLPDTFALADLLFEDGMASFDAGKAFAWMKGLRTAGAAEDSP
jgi:HAD superfamily hydrolase (TIGR01509 family)